MLVCQSASAMENQSAEALAKKENQKEQVNPDPSFISQLVDQLMFFTARFTDEPIVDSEIRPPE